MSRSIESTFRTVTHAITIFVYFFHYCIATIRFMDIVNSTFYEVLLPKHKIIKSKFNVREKMIVMLVGKLDNSVRKLFVECRCA